MSTKFLLFLLFFLFISFATVFSDDYHNFSFPGQINYPLVSAYVLNKKNLSNKEMKTEYDYILVFLDTVIAYCKVNIKNAYSFEIFTQWQPVLSDGKLIFSEKERKKTVWDAERQKFREMADIDVIMEIAHMLAAQTTYNQFVDHWYQLTGEILRDSFDIEKELDCAKLMAFRATSGPMIRLKDVTNEIN
jgi:hypothetical protein